MVDQKTKKWVRSHFASLAKFNEPMRRHTSFRVGGPAELFIEPETSREALSIAHYARENKIPLFVAGGGTNLLVADSGIQGIVLSLAAIRDDIQVETSEGPAVKVTVPAGTRTAGLCRFALKNSLGGMNFALGIPGTVGGAVKMNAGTLSGCMADVLDSVVMIDPAGTVKKVAAEEMDFSYRNLSWKQGNHGGNSPVILKAVVSLCREDRAGLKKEAEALIKKRKRSQPVSLPSAGCFFKNPSKEHPAGKLIDQAGLKGKRIGDAQISEQHANFIVNRGNAKAGDIIALMKLAREKVSALFGITLETEVQIVGT